MTQLSILAILSILALTRGQSNLRRQEKSIKWTDCEYPWDTTRPIACAKLAVPLDYTDDGSPDLELDLVKIPATKQPVLGSMLINPGGPGVSGVQSAIDSSVDWLTAGGGQYNVIGFDPRGTGRTMPLNCTPTSGAALEARDKLVYSLNLTDVLAQKWDSYLSEAADCGAAHAANGHLYGTAFVARDMLQIVDALDEDGLLRYYGASYGTILGWTFAAMFPDRILDGNINPVEYWNGYDAESSVSTDGAFKNVVDACVANSDVCELASLGDADTIIESFNKALEELPSTAGLSAQEADSTILSLKKHISSVLYHASEYPTLADQMNLLIQGDFETLEASIGGERVREPREGKDQEGEDVEAWSKGRDGDGVSGITCPDWPLRVTSPSELEGLLALQEPMSSFVESVASDYWVCHVWPFESAERYQGPFEGIETKFPVLFINPTWDPITPLVSAQNSSATLVNSVLLEHRGKGHCSDSQPSLCTSQAMRDYMVDGTLPSDGSTCEPNMPLFGNMTEALLMNDPLREASNTLDSQVEGSSKIEENGGSSNGSSSGSSSNQSSSASISMPPMFTMARMQQVLLASFIGAVVLAI